MLRLRIIGKFNAKKINQIEKATYMDRPCGMVELFAELAQTGHCESYSASRIYYLAYLLSKSYLDLEFEIDKDEPKIQEPEDWTYEDIIRKEG